MDDVTLREIAAAYNRGVSVRGLASGRGWSYGATHARLLMAEQKGLTTIRTRGGVLPRHHTPDQR